MELEMLIPEITSAPDLACRGLERVWDPLRGEWVWTPVYEFTVRDTKAQDCQVYSDSQG